MHIANHSGRRAFTLVEIMVVVAVIALIAAIAVPNFVRSRRRAQATRILEDLRIVDYALDRWAVEKNKSVGDTAAFTDLQPYIRAGTPLYANGTDLLGNVIGPTFSVDVTPKVPNATYAALSDVAPAAFWSPFR